MHVREESIHLRLLLRVHPPHVCLPAQDDASITGKQRPRRKTRRILSAKSVSSCDSDAIVVGVHVQVHPRFGRCSQRFVAARRSARQPAPAAVTEGGSRCGRPEAGERVASAQVLVP